MPHQVCSIVLACAALAPAVCFAQAPRYRITDLSELAGSIRSYPYALNNASKTVGDAVFEEGFLNERPERFDAHAASAMQLLPGDNRGIARGINTAGLAVGASTFVRIEMVGHQTRIYETAHAAIWSGDQVVDLNTLVSSPAPLNLTFAWDVNDANQIVGWGLVTPPPTGSNPWHAFLLEGGMLRDLGILGPVEPNSSRTSEAWAINASGLIVGNGASPLFPIDNGHFHAVRWDRQPDGGYAITDLHHLPPIVGLASHAYGCSDLGDIVGCAQFNVSHPEEPCVWHDGTVTLLANLGFTQGMGLDVNNRRQIVGQTFFASGQARAVMWWNGQIYDLSTLIPQDEGWDWLYVAWDINQRGEIVGVGSRHGLLDQGFLLTPTCPADWNFDGAVNSQDYFDFLTDFFGNGPQADFNADGATNSQDYFDFLVAFFGGCA